MLSYTRFTNIQLWELAELGKIPKNGLFEDEEGNQMIWTGKSFQGIYREENIEQEQYVGMCLDDTWEYIGVLQ